MTSHRILGLGRFAAAMVLGVASFAANCTIVAANLSTAAPPAQLGPYAMQRFDLAVQNAIVDGTVVPSLPAPGGGTINFTPSTRKFSIPATWATWSHGYSQAVFRFGTGVAPTAGTITLPTSTYAFYVYVEGASFTTTSVTVTTDTGATIGPIQVDGQGGANGFAFYSDNGAETIASIQIASADIAFAVAEFGISRLPPAAGGPVTPVPTLSTMPLMTLALLIGLTGLGVGARRRFTSR